MFKKKNAGIGRCTVSGKKGDRKERKRKRGCRGVGVGVKEPFY
jgi:hypothetical protein